MLAQSVPRILLVNDVAPRPPVTSTSGRATGVQPPARGAVRGRDLGRELTAPINQFSGGATAGHPTQSARDAGGTSLPIFDQDRAVPERKLPEIEILPSVGRDDDPADNDRSGSRAKSWPDHPVVAAAAVVVLLSGAAAVALQSRSAGNRYEGLNALRDWASDQHDHIDPPAGVVLPDVTCARDPYDLVEARTCLRDAQRTGEPAGGLLRMDSSYPDAFDHWITIGADGRATITQRQVTVTRPDVEGTGKIQPWQLRTRTLSWRVWECEALVFSGEVDVYPGVQCVEKGDAPVRPLLEHSESRNLTDAERQELVGAFACSHPEEFSEYDC